jgi:hypothetical protein
METRSTLGKTAAIALALLLVVLSWYGPIEEAARSQLDDGLKRSLVSFASARALNGVNSVIQGTQLAVEPLGVGVSLSVGEILDPINDLVEAFSTVMLTASVAFGIQKLLLVMGSNWVASMVVTGIALLWALLHFFDKAPHWLSRGLVIVLFIRFVMPVVTLGSSAVFDHLLKQDYEVNQQGIELTRRELTVLNGDPPVALPETESSAPKESPSTGEALKGAASSAKDTVTRSLKDPLPQARAKYEEIKRSAEQAAEKMIALIVIFLMQTIVIPLLLVWVLYRLSGGLVAPRAAGSP